MPGFSCCTWPLWSLVQHAEKEMAIHSSVLAWRIPGTGQPGGLLSMGPHRVGHHWSNLVGVVADLLLFALLCVIPNISSKWKGGLSGGLDSKESSSNARDQGLLPGLRRSPGERKWQPIPVSLPGESHGQRRLASCSPWGHKESDTTEVT